MEKKINFNDLLIIKEKCNNIGWSAGVILVAIFCIMYANINSVIFRGIASIALFMIPMCITYMFTGMFIRTKAIVITSIIGASMVAFFVSIVFMLDDTRMVDRFINIMYIIGILIVVQALIVVFVAKEYSNVIASCNIIVSLCVVYYYCVRNEGGLIIVNIISVAVLVYGIKELMRIIIKISKEYGDKMFLINTANYGGGYTIWEIAKSRYDNRALKIKELKYDDRDDSLNICMCSKK